MLYPFKIIFDSIFPPTEHELLLRNVSAERFIYWYQPKLIRETVCLSEYNLPEVKAAITAGKFEHNYHAARLLSALVEKYLLELPLKKTLLLPIPLSSKRKGKRGFNQVERVLRKVHHLPRSYSINTSLLIRPTDTPPQTSLAKAERIENIHGKFLFVEKNKFYLDGIERIIICDDVMTTGATLNAAKASLVPHLDPTVEIICLSWAH